MRYLQHILHIYGHTLRTTKKSGVDQARQDSVTVKKRQKYIFLSKLLVLAVDVLSYVLILFVYLDPH